MKLHIANSLHRMQKIHYLAQNILEMGCHIKNAHPNRDQYRDQYRACSEIGVIKGPESWWIAKSITISRVVNQSKVNPQRPKGVVD